MNQRILHVLEFKKIIEQLNEQAASSLGKEKTAALKPSSDLEEVRHLQMETDEAGQVLRLKGHVPLGGIFDIKPSLKRTTIGGTLSALECLDVASTIYGGRQLKRFIEDMEEPEMPILRDMVSTIAPLRELESEIRNCIDEHGGVMDGASEKLRSIRSKIRTYESRVRDKMESFTKSKSKMLSDAIVTIRNERYVLPVKQEYRGSIGGIVHDQSSSGATLFIEPQTVVDLNNQLQEARVQEKNEIEKILKELSDAIAENHEPLYENVNVLGHMDFMFARAKLGKQMRAAMPKMNDEGRIDMKQARHPLISGDEVVPNDIEIGKDYTSIVITGPNTGGKTVTLKLVGLCTLMAQSGLQVPALDGCEMAVFKEVYADIGDEQSIEQSLSTFSSHMTNIVDILDKVDDQSLVLFDELGAGTDPQEGAALAMSILDEVVNRKARVIATTHYPELKAYGYNRPDVINASVEFDIQTLKPTYRLLIGVPGRSNAFEISRRLGLRESVIESAKGHIGVDSQSVENMIASLEESKRGAEQDYEEAERFLAEAEELRNELKQKWDQFEEQREKLYEKAEQKAEKAIRQAREEAETIVGEIRNMKSQAQMKEHEWIEARKMFDEAQPELAKKKPKAAPAPKKESRELNPGDEVKLLTLNQQGTIVEQTGKNEYQVQVGVMKVKAKRKELEFVKAKQPYKEKPMATVKGKNFHVKTELDLRGERYEDALNRLEKYIDDALLAGYPRVSIIHGKGTGALRTAVQNFAKNHRSISSHRAGGMNEGGSGVTVLEFR
ncbi:MULTISPECIES: endonuclease MutS2 [Halobacillus]|uniref:Endonuclease MutS2 n=2 Tax=Halobacillus TaxID=45667 RepID=A0A3E0JCV7_9BACI|nr:MULTISPECIES: endonuclease MutS2 [Halobacillus]RDY71280.1 endonuclease MutS2 [Halobacillus trueperi]REJ10783.1 endonuclease MutS2 [Halobacillus trueperi]SDN78707.1 DNA mismatch repair protein MutS2 [Halobacillus aidingensis]